MCGMIDLEGRYREVFVIVFGKKWGARVVGDGRRLGYEGEARSVCDSTEASVSTVIDGR